MYLYTVRWLSYCTFVSTRTKLHKINTEASWQAVEMIISFEVKSIDELKRPPSFIVYLMTFDHRVHHHIQHFDQPYEA